MSERFPIRLPHGDLAEVLPDVFFVQGQTRPVFGGRQLQFSRSMTVLREGDDLTLINTLRLNAAGLAALEALGTVRHVVKLGSFHGRDDAFYLDRYGATMWAFPGTPHERGVVTDAELSADAAPLADARGVLFETSSQPEGLLLLARHGGVLVACDSLQNLTGPDRWFDEPTAAMMGAQGFYRPANVGPGWLNICEPRPSDLQRVRALPFQHLLSAHGPPLLNTARGAVAATLDALFSA